MLVGREDLEGFLLDRARRAVALLRPTDPVKLQEAALKNLASALRKVVKIDQTQARAEARALEDRIAALPRAPGQDHARAARVDPTARADTIPWARNFAAARKRAGAEGKLIMVEFAAESSDWCQRLDVDVFPSPEVAGAMRPFVAVKVDPDDGEGRPLLARYRAHIKVCPTFLFLDPAIDDPGDARIVGKMPGYMPADIFVDHLTTIARLPRDVDAMAKEVHPEDGDAMRRLATALAMQGRVKEAIALVDRAWGPGVDREFDRWATVYNTIADEIAMNLKTFDDVGELDVEALGGEAAMLRKFGEAAGWYGKAARIAKRPIDAYNARVGAGFVAAIRQEGGAAVRELETAARATGVSRGDRAFAVGLLRELAEPPDGVPEAAAALKRLP
jgi:thioredoxin-related protein